MEVRSDRTPQPETRIDMANHRQQWILIPIKIDNGEEKAWGLVCGLPREEVCRSTGAGFDEKAGAYLLRCYGRDFHVNPCEMLISCPTDRGALFLGKLKDFFRLAVLWYMANAKEIPPTGRLCGRPTSRAATASRSGPTCCRST